MPNHLAELAGRPRSQLLTAIAVSFCVGSQANAGMPSPLFDDIYTITRLTDDSIGRLQAISFFLVGIAVSVVIVQWLWNVLARDSMWLPRITLVKAFALVMLWGFLFVIVLTMISGARELMTPGAWKKTGVTYELRDAP